MRESLCISSDITRALTIGSNGDQTYSPTLV